MHLTPQWVDYTDLTAVIRVEVDCLFIDSEMPGLRIVRVGSQNTRTYNSFRTRRTVAPILPGFIGDALPRSKYALVNSSVHPPSDDSNEYCPTCLQETSSIQGHRLQVVARRKRRIACSYSRCSRTSLQLSRLALIFSAHALFLLPPRSFYRPVTTFSARRSSWRPTPISYTCRRQGRSGGRIRHINFLMRYLGDFLDCAQLVNNTAKPLPWPAGHSSE